jgi:hypothetical protein
MEILRTLAKFNENLKKFTFCSYFLTIRRMQDEYATDFHEDHRQIWRVRGGHKEIGDSAQLQPGPIDDRRRQEPAENEL